MSSSLRSHHSVESSTSMWMREATKEELAMELRRIKHDYKVFSPE